MSPLTVPLKRFALALILGVIAGNQSAIADDREDASGEDSNPGIAVYSTVGAIAGAASVSEFKWSQKLKNTIEWAQSQALEVTDGIRNQALRVYRNEVDKRVAKEMDQTSSPETQLAKKRLRHAEKILRGQSGLDPKIFTPMELGKLEEARAHILREFEVKGELAEILNKVLGKHVRTGGFLGLSAIALPAWAIYDRFWRRPSVEPGDFPLIQFPRPEPSAGSGR